MDFFIDNLFLIMFIPLWISLIILSGAFFKLTENRKITTLLTCLSTITGLIFSILLLNQAKSVTDHSFLWLNTDGLKIYLGTFIDSTSVIFLTILMFVSLIVQIYSYGYMKDKQEFNRYYIYLNFFNFSMTGLILSPNFIQLYIFWALISFISYLLIGFFHNKEDVSKSAKKAFVINKIGDIALLLGIIILAHFSITYIHQEPNQFLSFSSLNSLKLQLQSLTHLSMYNMIFVLFLFSAFVKSAQFPLQQWLIEARKAPIPVNALIHSATMCCAGIFLVIRIYPLLTDMLLNIILAIGLTTAVICAFIAIFQTDIKKLLAYSTSSQLGLVFTAIGLKSIPIAIIYLVIHSFTKTLILLCTGNIEKITNSTDSIHIAGLKKTDAFLSFYWIVSGLSLSGIFFGGFTSKEMLLNLSVHNKTLLFLILLTTYLTAFYIFKTYFKIFEGNKREEYNAFKLSSISFCLMMLSVFVIFPGFLFRITDINILCVLSIAIGITAIISAYFKNK